MLEIVIAVAIIMLMLVLAMPSLKGVLDDQRLRRSLDGFNALVLKAQERSVTEHRSYLIVWQKDAVVLRPEAFGRDEEEKDTAELNLGRGEALKLSLPAALTKDPPGEWIFWPSGNCEPAVIEFTGGNGTWTAKYSPLTARPEITKYVAR